MSAFQHMAPGRLGPVTVQHGHGASVSPFLCPTCDREHFPFCSQKSAAEISMRHLNGRGQILRSNGFLDHMQQLDPLHAGVGHVAASMGGSAHAHPSANVRDPFGEQAGVALASRLPPSALMLQDYRERPLLPSPMHSSLLGGGRVPLFSQGGHIGMDDGQDMRFSRPLLSDMRDRQWEQGVGVRRDLDAGLLPLRRPLLQVTNGEERCLQNIQGMGEVIAQGGDGYMPKAHFEREFRVDVDGRRMPYGFSALEAEQRERIQALHSLQKQQQMEYLQPRLNSDSLPSSHQDHEALLADMAFLKKAHARQAQQLAWSSLYDGVIPPKGSQMPLQPFSERGNLLRSVLRQDWIHDLPEPDHGLQSGRQFVHRLDEVLDPRVDRLSGKQFDHNMDRWRDRMLRDPQHEGHQDPQLHQDRQLDYPNRQHLGGILGSGLDRRLGNKVDRNLDHQIDQNMDRGLDHQLNHSMERNMDRQLEHIRDRNLGRQLDHSIVRNLSRELDYNVDQDLGRQLDHNMDRGLDCQMGDTMDPNPDDRPEAIVGRTLDRQLDYSMVQNVDRQLDYSMAQNVDRQLDHHMAWNLDRQLDHSMDRILDRNFERNLDHNADRSLEWNRVVNRDLNLDHRLNHHVAELDNELPHSRGDQATNSQEWNPMVADERYQSPLPRYDERPPLSFSGDGKMARDQSQRDGHHGDPFLPRAGGMQEVDKVREGNDLYRTASGDQYAMAKASPDAGAMGSALPREALAEAEVQRRLNVQEPDIRIGSGHHYSHDPLVHPVQADYQDQWRRPSRGGGATESGSQPLTAHSQTVSDALKRGQTAGSNQNGGGFRERKEDWQGSTENEAEIPESSRHQRGVSSQANQSVFTSTQENGLRTTNEPGNVQPHRQPQNNAQGPVQGSAASIAAATASFAAAAAAAAVAAAANSAPAKRWDTGPYASVYGNLQQPPPGNTPAFHSVSDQANPASGSFPTAFASKGTKKTASRFDIGPSGTGLASASTLQRGLPHASLTSPDPSSSLEAILRGTQQSAADTPLNSIVTAAAAHASNSTPTCQSETATVAATVSPIENSFSTRMSTASQGFQFHQPLLQNVAVRHPDPNVGAALPIATTTPLSAGGELAMQGMMQGDIRALAPPYAHAAAQAVAALALVQQQLQAVPEKKHTVYDAAAIFRKPGRMKRPSRFVVILRGLPGSGKSYLAKALRDVEVMNGGSPPRIHSMDDYFMIEVEKEMEVDDGVSGKASPWSKRKVVKKVKEYCYEPEMEKVYKASMFKAFRKTLEEGRFTFIIVDDCNVLVADFSQYWAAAKRAGYEVYVLQATYQEPLACSVRNVHGFTEEQVRTMAAAWEPTPLHHLLLDVSSLFRGDDLGDDGITEVEMDAADMGRDLEEADDDYKGESFRLSSLVKEARDDDSGDDEDHDDVKPSKALPPTSIQIQNGKVGGTASAAKEGRLGGSPSASISVSISASASTEEQRASVSPKEGVGAVKRKIGDTAGSNSEDNAGIDGDDNDDNSDAYDGGGGGNALSGLMKAYGKSDKRVRWADFEGQKELAKGFTIGASLTKRTKLEIGPGAGYNEAETSKPEDRSLDSPDAEHVHSKSKFIAQLRAEQETFRAVLAKRRQRIETLDDDDD